MQNEICLKEYHIGKKIKEIAAIKGISSEKIATVLKRYHHNADKIFHKEDMYADDVVKISYLLNYNLLLFVVQKYLQHLPFTKNKFEADCCLLQVDMTTRSVTDYHTQNHSEFICNIHVGQHIRKVAKNNGLSIKEMAKKLRCAQSMVSYLYRKKSLKLKTLIYISNALHYNFIAELYLSQMVISPIKNILENCIIKVSQQHIRVFDPNDKERLIVYQRISPKHY